MPPPVPLPPLGNLFDGDEAAYKAYARLLPLENHQELVIRILGQMLIQAPSVEGRAYVARRINNCINDRMVFDLGQSYLSHFIAYFRSTSEAFSTPKSLWESPSEEDISDSLVEAVAKHAEVKQQALIRDNYRCMLSSTVDTISVESLPWLMDEVMNSRKILVMSTHCCPILPRCENYGPAKASENPVTFGNLTQLFGDVSGHGLSGSGINDLRNLMTLSIEVHESFSKLEIWLEPIEGTENQYNIRRRDLYIEPHLPPMVAFSNVSTDLPLPDPRYLALHAACARVIQLTGAAKYIAGILRNAEGMK
ncbi:hypothetical protein FRC11_008215, partial [Ceratobasidium sp. 423]